MIKSIPADILPKISVITVSFNQAEFIKENIESVLAQNYPNFEHIVVDGGSKDGTIEILKSYHHLKWTSEPDRGQTHALNKGFAQADGDIIAWLNSDDYYPKNIFNEIAEALRNDGIVIGACQVTDKAGKHTDFVPNIGRSWFDILKYWVYFSSPAQPSIFFRREILEEFKRKDGTYLDEALDFCMDYEFWLRIARKYPLTKYIPKILSYCRIYESNKTSRDMDSVYREMSRVFARYSNLSCRAERKLSFVVPFKEFNAQLLDTVASIITQTLKDFEVLLVDYCEDEKLCKEHRRQVLDLEKKIPLLTLRYSRSLESGLLKTLQQVFEEAVAPYIAVLEPGATVGETFCLDVVNLFRQDAVGMALPLKHQDYLSGLKLQDGSGRVGLNLENIFKAPWIAPCFVARTVALHEINGIKNLDSDLFSIPELALRMIYRGWNINVDNNLDLKVPASERVSKNNKLSENINFYMARIISDLQAEFEVDAFGRIRAAHGFALVFPESTVQAARQLLAEDITLNTK